MTRLRALLCRSQGCQRRPEANSPYCESHYRLIAERAIAGPAWKKRLTARDETGRVMV